MAEALSSSTIKELVKLGQQTGTPVTVTSNGVPFAVIPHDCKVVALTEFLYNVYAERPHRKIGTVNVLDASSFVEYWSLFSDEHSRVFADETKSAVLGVLDYHGAHENAPRWGGHRLNLTLRASEEWQTWTTADGQKHAQIEFAEFIEDNTPDIVEPSAATMLEVARSLQAKTDVDFSSAIRLSNGQTQFKYTEQIKGTYGSGQVDIPEEFTVRIPVYVGTDRVPIRARLRYRLSSGNLTFWFDLLRPDAIMRDAFMRVLEAIQAGIGTKIINGNPS